MITGLATLELLKVVTREDRKVEDFKNAFVNLGIPLWVLSEPSAPLKNLDVEYDPIVGGPVRCRPKGFTSWDKLTLEMTSEFILLMSNVLRGVMMYLVM